MVGANGGRKWLEFPFDDSKNDPANVGTKTSAAAKMATFHHVKFPFWRQIRWGGEKKGKIMPLFSCLGTNFAGKFLEFSLTKERFNFVHTGKNTSSSISSGEMNPFAVVSSRAKIWRISFISSAVTWFIKMSIRTLFQYESWKSAT